MDWDKILTIARRLKEDFLRSHKCLNTDRETKSDTVNKHVNTLVRTLQQIRVLFNVNFDKLKREHQTAAETFYSDIRDKLLSVTTRKGISIKIPISLHEEIHFEPLIETNQEQNTQSNMAQTIVQFLNTASKLIPDFDGSPENLQSFIDALDLVDSIKESHEAAAVNIVKTKLKGTARNLIASEATLQQIITKLKGSVKGDSVDVITAKILNIKQHGKTANAYAKEIEDLTKKLETAYISDGLPNETATKYATRSAVTAIAKNASNERVKLIIESGTFSNMNEVISKFISSCTDANVTQNFILSFGTNYNHYHNNTTNRGYRSNMNTQGNSRNYNNNNNRNYRSEYARNNTRYNNNNNFYRQRNMGGARNNNRYNNTSNSNNTPNTTNTNNKRPQANVRHTTTDTSENE